MPFTGSASKSADKRERFGLMSMRECRKAEKGEPGVCKARGTSHQEDVQETVVERSEDWNLQKSREIRFDDNAWL